MMMVVAPMTTLAEFALMLLASYGMCFGLMNDKLEFLSRWFRRSPFLDAMFSCAYCTGFHTGWFAWLLVRMADLSPLTLPTDGVAVILAAFASAAFCYAVDQSLLWLERTPHEA